MKEAYEKRIKEKEESMIKWSVDAYYMEVKHYLMSCPAVSTFEEEDKLFKVWHHSTVEAQLNIKYPAPVALESSKKKVIPEKENKTPNAKPLESVDVPPKALDVDKPPKEDKAKEIISKKEYEIQLTKRLEKEALLMCNLMLMLRDMKVLSNDANEVARIFRDQKEKQRFGIIWEKGDDDAVKVIGRFFRLERVFKRL